VKLDVPTLARLSPLMDEALELDDEQLAVWFSSISANDTDLIPALRELLSRKASVQTSDILQRGPDFTAPGVADHQSDFKADDTVGPYRLLRELGRGGMGEVWLAVRIDGSLKRQVALKLPHSTLPQRQLAERFARERDILGSLVHPNIARLYDAGVTPEGQPYLALEYVEGEVLTTWCDAHKLGIKARIELFRQVFATVEYAHRQLVLHRDLKPTNILVTAAGEVRLLDFGIAKLMTDGQAQETALTQLGGRALSLQYASPEQIQGMPLGTTSDVYSLGVVMHELLTGSLPYRLHRGSNAALEEAVLSSDPTRAGRTQISIEQANARGDNPRRLQVMLKGDIETILQKSLKKRSAERYGSARAFAEDFERFLNGKPVLAQPDSRWYRTAKFLRRNWLATGAATAVVVSLAAGLTVALWQAAHANQQAALAHQEAQRAQAVQSFLLNLFKANSTLQVDPQAAQRTTARELLDRGAARIDQELADQPQSRIEVLATLADMYGQLGLEKQAASLQDRRLDLARRSWGAQDPRLAQLLLDQIEGLQDSDRRNEIPALLDEAQATLRRTPDADPVLQGDALIVAARYWRYESLTKARQGAEQAVVYLSQHPSQSDALVTAYLLAARAALSAGDPEGGEAHARQAIATAKRQGDGAAAWQATPTGALADALQLQLELDAAETAQREQVALTSHVHGDLHPDTLGARIRLGNLLLTLGRGAEGESLHETVRQALTMPDPRYSAQWRSYTAGLMGNNLLDRGRPDLLAPLLRADLINVQRTLPRAPLRAQRERVLAEALAAQGDIVGARQTLAAAREHWSQFADGSEAPRIQSLFALSQARIELAASNPAAALPLLAPERPATHIDALARQVERACALLQLGSASEAAANADAALLTLGALPGNNRPLALQASALEWRGLARRALGDVAAARTDLQQALSLRRNHDMPASIHVARIKRELAAPPGGTTTR
jgi:serine/threonine-protein kinase